MLAGIGLATRDYPGWVRAALASAAGATALLSLGFAGPGGDHRRANRDRASGAEGQDAVAEPSLGEVVRQLVSALQPEQIYLFGSRARGDNQVDSDYDFMVIVRGSDLPPHRRAQLAHQALHRIRVAADILVSTRQEFDRFLSVPGSLAATILREGRLLYDARRDI